jgi:hypothetical protein
MMTPKQAAKSLVKYSRHHPDTEMYPFVIPQVPGSIPRSTPVDGVIESLVKSKKYVVPIAVLHPYIAGTLIAAYFSDGRFHPDPHAVVFNPTLAVDPTAIIHTSTAAPGPALATQSVSPSEGSSSNLPRP